MTALADLQAMIANAPGAKPVVFGAFSTTGILDFSGQPWGAEDQAQVGGELITLTYCYPDLPGLGSGSSLTVGGQPYSATTQPRRKADGLEAVICLEAL